MDLKMSLPRSVRLQCIIENMLKNLCAEKKIFVSTIQKYFIILHNITN